MCIYYNENCVLVTNFKTWGFAEHFLMESGNENTFRLVFTMEKVRFKLTRYFVNKTQSRLPKLLTEGNIPVFFERYVTSYRVFFFFLQNLTF